MFFKDKDKNDDLTRSSASSSELAKERLKSILMRDRVDVSRETLDCLKTEMISVARDYFMIKDHSCEVYLTTMKRTPNEESDTILVCLLPIVKAKSKVTG